MYEDVETVAHPYTPSHPGLHPYLAPDFGVQDSDTPLEELSVEAGDLVRILRVLESGDWIVVEKLKKGDMKGKGKAGKPGVIPAYALRRLESRAPSVGVPMGGGYVQLDRSSER
jgi:hypothetical protein